MSLRLCIPSVSGRGAGLGNELVPWARAYVASTVLGARLLPPAFGLNRRPYRLLFGTPRLDWLGHRALEELLPRVHFDESAWLRHGADLALAVRRHAEEWGIEKRRAFVWTTSGMWGGYRHILAAKDFVLSTLRASQGAVRNLGTIRSRLAGQGPVVGMHVRMGDFEGVPEDGIWQGRFNVSLPMQWYVEVARSIRSRLGSDVRFLVVSDATAAQLEPLIREVGVVTTSDLPLSDVSDLLALAQCDILVCSVSSFSCWAAFLSNAPYIWFKPNLQRHGALGSVWGHEPAQRAPGSPTLGAVERFRSGTAVAGGRGVPVDLDGRIPDRLFDAIGATVSHHDPDCDLVTYGVQPLD